MLAAMTYAARGRPIRVLESCAYGCGHDRAGLALLRFVLGAGNPVPAPDGRWIVNALYVIAGVISLALFVYLMVALLKPEVF